MLGAALVAAASVSFTPPKLFGDWYAGCDNAHYCAAVALLPESSYQQAQPKYFSLTLELKPDGAPAALGINAINPEDPDKTPDLRLALLGDAKATGARFDKNGKAAAVPPAIVTQVARARSLTLADSAGKVVGHVSTAGAAKALAFVRQLQSRPAPPLPRIATPPHASTPPARPTAVQMRKIMKAHDCPGYDEKPQFVRLDAATSLALLPCSDQGDETDSVAVLVSNAGAIRAPLFDSPYEGEPRSGAANDLSIASFDMKTFSLVENLGSPAMGDCGGTHAWVWDGARFRLAYQDAMEQCRGSYSMVPVWRTANLPNGVPSQ
jgi:hypothetical protein